MIKLTSLLNELTFRNQAAFDKYSSTHKMRDTTKVTIDGKKTTVGAAEKKGKSSNKNKTNIFDKPKKDDSKKDVKKDTKRGFLNTISDLLFGKPVDDTKSDTNTDTKKEKKPKKHITVGAPYAEKPEYWENQFEVGDEDNEGNVVEPWQYSSWNMMKIAAAAMDFCKDDDKLKPGTTAKDYGYKVGLSADSAGYEQSIVCKTKSGEIGPICLRLSSPNADGRMNITIGYNKSHELTGISDDDSFLFGIFSDDMEGMDEPELTYQEIRTVMLHPETAKLLKGEMSPDKYAPIFKEIEQSILNARKSNNNKPWPPGDHNNGWNAKKKKKDNKNESIRLSGILSEITDDALLDKTITYKDSMGRDKEIKIKTALSKTYRTAKEPGMQNAYRTAKAMWDKAHGTPDNGTPDKGSNTGSHARPKTDADFLQAISGKPDPNKKPNRGTIVQKPEPQKLGGSDFKTSAEKPVQQKSGNDDMKLKSLMPGMDTSKKTLSEVPPIERQKISTVIDDLAKMGAEAKAKGEKAPNFNLCKVTIPGTNLYCDGNKGIERADMPQFKGTPRPGSPADKLPKDENGEADTEEFFKKMLEKDGIKVSEPQAVPPDRLKATQSELVGVKVAGMSKVLADPNHPAYEKITAPIYVSNDGYVLDGHHRWAAVVAHNAANPDNQIPMNVRVIDEPIVPLVKRSNAFAEHIGIRAKAADTGAGGGPQPIVTPEKKK